MRFQWPFVPLSGIRASGGMQLGGVKSLIRILPFVVSLVVNFVDIVETKVRHSSVVRYARGRRIFD